MLSPEAALLLFGLIVGVFLVLFWPKIGLVARLRHVVHLTERVRLEDALKQLYHHTGGGENQPFSVARLAGSLETSRARALRLVERLGELDLASLDADRVTLTTEGREYALRILRTHRLWERYLADRTGVAPGEWHLEAERQEHLLSTEEAERLAARMGHPVYDPHGDPIPTAAGEIPPPEGRPLTQLQPGPGGVIVHLEDEPPEVFADLVRAGFSPGMVVEVEGVEGNQMSLRVGGEPVRLSLLQAANVTLRPIGAADRVDAHTGWSRTLADLGPGDEAPILGLSPACQGTQRRRLLDLGVVPGTRVRVEMTSASGDPSAYRIRGALIALRRQQAAWIGVDPVVSGQAEEGAA